MSVQQPQQNFSFGLGRLAASQQQNHGRHGKSGRVHCHQPGVLVLAHIHTNIAFQQQQSPWEWVKCTFIWPGNEAVAADGSKMLTKNIDDAARQYPEGAMATHNQVAVVGLLPDSNTPQQQSGHTANSSWPDKQLHHQWDESLQHEQQPQYAATGWQQQQLDELQEQQRQLLHMQQQQYGQSQQAWPLVGPQFASTTFNGTNGTGWGVRNSNEGLLLCLRAFGKAINSEAGKLIGLLGAQLLMHLANLQRGMHALQQQQQQGSLGQQQQGFGWWPRLPWQRQEHSRQGAAGQGRQQKQQQSAAWQAQEAAQQWVARGMAAEKRIDLREALACYTNAVTLDPGNAANICRLAKQWSDLTYEDGVTVEQIQEVNGKAVEYAERAIALAPKSASGHMASCVSRGRLALFSDNKTKVRLAKEAQEAARTALALEPQNDLAHHLMGRWHFEMAQINFMVRHLIKLVYGAALAPGKFEDALAEFQTAVQLNPHKLIHRVELGRIHLRLGHMREAYEQLKASLALEVEDVNAKLQKEDAELLLQQHKGEFERSVSWGGFTSPGIAGVDSSSIGSVPAACSSATPDASSSGGPGSATFSSTSSIKISDSGVGNGR